MILRNATTQVMVDYEWGAECWVTIGRLTRWLRRVPEEYSLQEILRVREPGASFPNVGCQDYEKECIDTALRTLGELTAGKAAPLLRGDFSIAGEIRSRRTPGGD